MHPLNMEYLIRTFDRAKELNYKFIGIKIHMDGFKKDEVIINEAANFDTKLEYYKKVYDEELNHKFSQGISISGFTFGNSYAEIQEDLVW